MIQLSFLLEIYKLILKVQNSHSLATFVPFS